MPAKTITAAEQRRAAKIFTQLSMLATVLMPLIIPMLFWIAASIFVHASIAHHPNQRVRDYLYPAGYRFYGVLGTWVVVPNLREVISKFITGEIDVGLVQIPMFYFWLWIVSVVVIVPFGIRDILRANKENWQDMTVEVEHA